MIQRDHPLDLATWLARAVRLGEKVGAPQDARPDRVLRQAFHLSKLLPDPLWPLFSAAAGEEEFEALLARGDEASATARFLNAGLRVAVESPAGAFRVHIACPRYDCDIRFAGPALAPAVVGAWLGCLGTVAWDALGEGRVTPGPHRLQCAPPPSSTRH